MFHIELRQRPDVARAFNLDERELITRFLALHVAGKTILYQDHEFEPRKASLTVIEGPELPVGQMGLGRGWSNVTKRGTDVTAQMVQIARERTTRPAGLDQLKERLLGRINAGAVGLGQVIGLADDLLPGRRVSERLAIAELAVWELLHAGTARLEDQGVEVADADRWQLLLLSAASWLSDASEVRVRAGTSAVRPDPFAPEYP